MTSVQRLAVAVSAMVVTGLLTVASHANPLRVGDRAPDFRLAGSTGREVHLSDFRGKKMVLIEFYHTDWGPDCTGNLSERRDTYDEFRAANIEVVGISMETSYSQQQFAASLGLPYPLLSDYPDGKTIRAYGVDYREGLAQRLFARPSFFLVDVDGFIRGYWGQRPPAPDEVLAPDPLVASTAMLGLALNISR